MGNWITSLGIPEVAEGLVCCTSSAFTGIFARCSVSHPRFAFSLFLIIGTVFSFIVLAPNMRHILDKIPYFCSTVTTDEMCDNLVGYGAVYRICFSLSLFYLIFALFMINTTSTADFRYKIHNGYWFLKLMLLVLILVGAFHIPRRTEFGRTLMYTGLTGGFMFIIIQVLLVIDFAHSWNISWEEKVDSGNTNFWHTALAFATILIYSIAVTMAAFFYLYFTDLRDLSKCRGNMFLITFNLSHCLLASVISVLPRVQEEAQVSGLLQSSVVSLYTMYLTWCALSSEPDASCNPLGDVILDYDKASGVNGQALFESVLMFALLLFACNVRSSTSKLEKIGFSLSKIPIAENLNYLNIFEERLRQKRRDKSSELDNGVDDKSISDEEKFVEYNYSYFHFIMFLGSLQLMMVTTNWHSPDELADMKKLVKNWATVWIQLSSSILCVLIYIWATVAPLLVKVWGPCLGLDYALLPTYDDYENRRCHKNVKAMHTSREDAERYEAQKRLEKEEKLDEWKMRNEKYDTNVPGSHSVLGCQDDLENGLLSIQPEPKVLETIGNSKSFRSNSPVEERYNFECRQDERLRASQLVNNDSIPKPSIPSRNPKQLLTTREHQTSASNTPDKRITKNESMSSDESSLDKKAQKMTPRIKSSKGRSLSQKTIGNNAATNDIKTQGSCSRMELSKLPTGDRCPRSLIPVGNTKMALTTEKDEASYPQSHYKLSKNALIDRATPVNKTYSEIKFPNSEQASEVNQCYSQNDHRSSSDTVRTTSKNYRNIYPQMQDHIAWVKRLRKMGRDLPSKNKRKISKPRNEKKDIDIRGCPQDISEKMIDSKQFLVTQKGTNDKGQKRLGEDRILETIKSSNRVNDEVSKQDNSAIFQHPFVHALGEHATLSEPQSAVVSKEIMRLQAKILKFQAKVVKTQQQILEIQSEQGAGRHKTELPNKNLA